MTSTPGRERAERMAAAYASGATLEEVGRTYNLTRERVRQVLKKYDFDMNQMKQDSKAARRERSTAQLEALIVEGLRSGATPHSIAQRAGVTLELVQAIGNVDPDIIAMSRLGRRPLSAPLYSDVELLDCLRIANSELGGVMTAAEYGGCAAHRRLSDGRPWPGRQTAMGRFGSWRRALAAAGLPANPSSAIAGRRQFDREHCIDAILEVERHFGRVPTAREYEIYAREHGGLPSLATVRHRHGQWHLAVARAIEFRRGSD